jgi:hypothetical protein
MSLATTSTYLNGRATFWCLTSDKEFLMRNLLTGVVASIALATLFVGSASAASTTTSYDGFQQVRLNQATRDQLQRDDIQSWQHRAPLGVVVSPGDDGHGQSQAQLSRVDQGAFAPGTSAWLEASPAGQVIGQAASTDQSAENYSRD